jgi:hypothetical protein
MEATGAAGALATGAVGNIFDVIESGPNKWITIPEGGGGGSCRARAGTARPAARITAKIL